MEQLSSGNRVFARIVSPLVDGIKRIVTDIGIFTDKQAYKDEIARYESELQQKTNYANEPELKIEAEERPVVTS